MNINANANPNMPADRKASSALVTGDLFVLNGEVGRFVCWTGVQRSRLGTLARQAIVANGDGETVTWSLNMAGSVKVI